MKKREYFDNLMNELFNANKKSIEELVQDPEYCRFEDCVKEIVQEDFSRIGCDTSTGEPTNIGWSLWLESKATDKFIDRFKQKYIKQ